MPLHRLPVLLLAACLLAAADPADLSGTPDGRLHLSADGAELFTFSPFIADAGWKFIAPTAVAVEGDAPFRFEQKVGKDVVAGELRASGRDAKAEVAWAWTTPVDLSFNGLAVAGEASVAALGGGTWEIDGKKGEFPRVFAGAGVFGGEARSLRVAFPDGRSFALAFAQPAWVTLQDNRQWGGPTFAIRVGKGIGKLAAKERYELAMTVSVPQGLGYRRDLPVALAAGDDWIPLKTELEIEPGSALDFSGQGLTDGPCGAKGRIIATPDGHFACADEPGKARRFYGVNLCFSAQYLPKEQVDRLLDRLVRLGYNTVRIHHYEFRLTTQEWKPGFDWDPARVDQLDYLMAGCAKRGLWLTTDLYVSRPVPGKQIGLSGDRPEPERFKALVLVHEPAFQDWATFARKFLDRVNPYTGKRVADDPALAWISLINEGGPPGDAAKQYPQWIAAWNAWLAKRFPDRDALDAALGDLTDSEDPAAGTVALPDKISSGTRRARICQVFQAETERAAVERMRAVVRDELKCQALITDINCAGSASVPMQGARAVFDYVDEHFYVDHPVFLEGGWHVPSRCANANPVREGAPGGRDRASVRIWGKPFTISEWDYAGPGRFRGVGGMLTGALAALQDWDAVWRFAYGHKDKDLFEPAPIDYFNLANDPLNQAADRVAVLLYLRRDLTPAPGRLAVAMPLAQLRDPPPHLSVAGIEAQAFTTRIGNALLGDGQQAPADAVVVPLRQAGDRAAVAELLKARGIPPEESGAVIRSQTGEVLIDRARGVLVVDTPRSAGGYADPGQGIAAARAGVRIDAITTGATVFVCSLDAAPISASRRLLVTHLTDLQNTGARYAESARQTLLGWGGLPHLVRDGGATVRIALAEPSAYTVWALSTGGTRIAKVPATVEAGGLSFQVRVKGAEGARMMYEVTR